MPILHEGVFHKILKSLPLTLHADGTATVTIRYFYRDAVTGEEIPAEEKVFTFTAAQVSEVLDIPGVPGVSRRDDLNNALYTYMVVNGFVPQGQIL